MASSVIDGIQRLAQYVSALLGPDAGYSVRSLYQTHGDHRMNGLTVFEFRLSPPAVAIDGKSEPLGGGYNLFSSWMSLGDAHAALLDMDETKNLRMGKISVQLPTAATSPLRWDPVDHIRKRDGRYSYGLDMPATMCFYGSGQSFQLEADFLQLHGFNSDSTNEFVWFRLLGVEGTMQNNCRIHNKTGILIIVPHHAWIDEIEVEDNWARVVVRTKGNPSWDGLRLRYKAYSYSGLKTDGRFIEIGEGGVTNIQSPFEDISGLDVTLELPPFWIDENNAEKRQSTTNTRLVAHNFLDEGSKVLEEKLLSPDGKDIDFEWAVAILFHIVGLQVEWWDCKSVKKGSRGDKAIDVVAFDEEARKAFAIECTVAQGDIEKKSQTVGSRAVSLEEALGARHKWQVLPFVCTPLTRKQLQAFGIWDSHKGKTRIISRDDLEDILRMLKAGAPKNEIVGRHLG